jgi:hypothetical protein
MLGDIKTTLAPFSEHTPAPFCAKRHNRHNEGLYQNHFISFGERHKGQSQVTTQQGHWRSHAIRKIGSRASRRPNINN